MDIEDLIKENFSKNKSNLNSTCRTCLSSKSQVEAIFDIESTVAEQILMCTGVQISFDDGLPTGLCQNCCSDLNVAHSFWMRCRRSEALLRNIKIEYEEANQAHDEVFSEKVPISNSSISVEKYVSSFASNILQNVSIKTECDVKSETNKSYHLSEYDNESSDDTETEEKKEVNGLKEKKHKCNICEKLLSSERSLDQHMKNLHVNKKRLDFVTGWGSQRRYNCIECSYSTPRSQSLIYHMRVHTGERPYKCELCDKCFSQLGTLNTHRKTHSDKMYFTCAECGKQFKYKESYEKHKSVHTESKFICDICNKRLKTKVTLISHMNRHENVKNFSCETCGALFVTRVELINHAKKHSDVRRFKCHLCSYESYLKKAVDLHIKRHIGDRPFKCDLCDTSCYTNGELKCHMRKHTKERNYACPVCELKFVHSSSVNKHMLKIHGVKYSRTNVVDRRTVK